MMTLSGTMNALLIRLMANWRVTCHDRIHGLHWIRTSRYRARIGLLDVEGFGMKPNWKDAPEWANWLAQDSLGDWEWHEDKPIPNSKFWSSEGNWNLASRKDNTTCDWCNTLEQRPGQEEWRGPEDGLPPVGAELRSSGGDCIVMAVQDRAHICVQWTDGELGIIRVECLHPRLSEEDKFIEDITPLICLDGALSPNGIYAKAIAERLYRSGYRKLDNLDASE